MQRPPSRSSSVRFEHVLMWLLLFRTALFFGTVLEFACFAAFLLVLGRTEAEILRMSCTVRHSELEETKLNTTLYDIKYLEYNP